MDKKIVFIDSGSKIFIKSPQLNDAFWNEIQSL